MIDALEPGWQLRRTRDGYMLTVVAPPADGEPIVVRDASGAQFRWRDFNVNMLMTGAWEVVGGVIPSPREPQVLAAERPADREMYTRDGRYGPKRRRGEMGPARPPCEETDEFGGTCAYRKGHVAKHRFTGGDEKGRHDAAVERYEAERVALRHIGDEIQPAPRPARSVVRLEDHLPEPAAAKVIPLPFAPGSDDAAEEDRARVLGGTVAQVGEGPGLAARRPDGGPAKVRFTTGFNVNGTGRWSVLVVWPLDDDSSHEAQVVLELELLSKAKAEAIAMILNAPENY